MNRLIKNKITTLYIVRVSCTNAKFVLKMNLGFSIKLLHCRVLHCKPSQPNPDLNPNA